MDRNLAILGLIGGILLTVGVFGTWSTGSAELTTAGKAVLSENNVHDGSLTGWEISNPPENGAPIVEVSSVGITVGDLGEMINPGQQVSGTPYENLYLIPGTLTVENMAVLANPGSQVSQVSPPLKDEKLLINQGKEVQLAEQGLPKDYPLLTLIGGVIVIITSLLLLASDMDILKAVLGIAAIFAVLGVTVHMFNPGGTTEVGEGLIKITTGAGWGYYVSLIGSIIALGTIMTSIYKKE